MDTRNEMREFLTSRRAKLKAADVGLPDYGARRVPGLRREEVAVLAGVSAPYYTRLERGEMAGASQGVLEALARALKTPPFRRTGPERQRFLGLRNGEASREAGDAYPTTCAAHLTHGSEESRSAAAVAPDRYRRRSTARRRVCPP